MISGSVTFNGDTPPFLSCNVQFASSDISFHPFKTGCFNGGFCLQSRLPDRPEDMYYVDDTNDIMVLLSGSVYNRNELSGCTDNSKPGCDPEMIAGLFLREGHAFVKKLNGDFVIFILRCSMKEAWLFRDHLGICPVGWVKQGGTLSFSTDVINLCRHYGGDSPIDAEFLLRFFKYVDYRRTPYQKVKKLAPGHFLKFSKAGIEITKYWEPAKIRTDRSLSYDMMISDLKELVHDAVRIRCDSRFTAGAHTSSGLDSGVVAALARKEYSYQPEFRGFSWSPGEFEATDIKYDEREIVRRFCMEAGIEPEFLRSGTDEYVEFTKRFYYNLGYYSEDEVSDRASLLGVNLIFSGWGGDEFISTGHSGIDLDLLRGFRIRTFLGRLLSGSPGRSIRHFLFFVVYPALRILDPKAKRAFKRDARYIREPFKHSEPQVISSAYFHHSRRQMHLNVLRFYNIPERCESWYRMGFVKGVKYRYPLLDKRIVEYMLRVPSKLLCRNHWFRPLLREIGLGLIPEEIRLNKSKNDPIFYAFMVEAIKKAALSVMDEVTCWRSNPDLHFVDFDLFIRDIELFRNCTAALDEKILSSSLVNLKAINEFTKEYRKDS